MEIRVDYNELWSIKTSVSKDGKKITEATYFFSILAWSFFPGIEENMYILKTIQHRLDYEHFFAAKEVKKAGIE